MASNPALMIIDVQPSFSPPAWLVTGIGALIGTMPSIATISATTRNGRRSDASLAGLPAVRRQPRSRRQDFREAWLSASPGSDRTPGRPAAEPCPRVRPSSRYLRARRRVCAVRCGPAPDASHRSCRRILDRPIRRSGREAVAPPLQACRDQPGYSAAVLATRRSPGRPHPVVRSTISAPPRRARRRSELPTRNRCRSPAARAGRRAVDVADEPHAFARAAADIALREGLIVESTV